MRHYEILLLIHPDQSEQIQAMVKRYKTTVKEQGGKVHRFEDWGRRPLAYPINKLHKAHYLLFNIECNQATLDELKSAFRYNDAVLRELIMKCDSAITTPSPMTKEAAAKKNMYDAPEAPEAPETENISPEAPEAESPTESTE